MKRGYFKKLLIAPALLLSLYSCKSSPKCKNAQQLQLEQKIENINLKHAKIESQKIFKESKNLILIIKDLHPDITIQNEIYSTLEELLEENCLKYTAIEGWRNSEYSHKTVMERIEQTCAMFPSECSVFEIGLLKKYEFIRKIWGNSAISQGNPAAYIFEFVYQDKIATNGIENEELHKRSTEELEKYVVDKRSNKTLSQDYFKERAKEIKNIIVTQRERAFVDNINKIIQAYDDAYLIALTVGGEHAKRLAKAFSDMNLSYAVISPNSLYKKTEEFKEATKKEREEFKELYDELYSE